MFRKSLLAAVVALGLFSGPVAAQSHLDLLRAGNYPAAREALARLVGGRPDADLHQAFLEALILIREGKDDRAAGALRAILDREPRFEPARRELAMLLARTGQVQGALYHAETLLGTTNDSGLRAALEGFIASQSAGKPRGITTRFSLLPSTNANGGTDAETIVIGGLPFTPDPASRATPALGLSFGITGWNRWSLSETWNATLSGSVDVRRYDHDAVADETVVAVRLDFGTAGSRHRLTFGPVADRMWKNDRPYRTRLGAGVSYQYRWRPDLVVGASATRWRQAHDDLGYLDGNLLSGALSATWIADADLTFSVALPFEVEQTGSPHLDHQSLGLRLGLDKTWNGGLSTGLNLGYSEDRYDGPYPAFGFPRKDKVTTVGLTLRSAKVQIGRFVPELSLTYERARSNIPFHDHGKIDVGLSLTQRF
ncbi:surface lipoprotein assembly modifier [Frigidibacter sp. SD6-1]|uniref:surface lipoprotein assembly modifier n=1 Tax=Frigidibacter sp. SD6-1 TaxID=3032581 RepID=UPI0024DF6D52|nr:surface lipoprotein assembly modifier [Frigidibacter sp. SD6-1]